MNLGVFLYHNETLEVPSQVVRDDFVAGGREELKKLTTAHPGLTDARVQRFSRKSWIHFKHEFLSQVFFSIKLPTPNRAVFGRFLLKMIINIVNYYLFDRL